MGLSLCEDAGGCALHFMRVSMYVTTFWTPCVRVCEGLCPPPCCGDVMVTRTIQDGMHDSSSPTMDHLYRHRQWIIIIVIIVIIITSSSSSSSSSSSLYLVKKNQMKIGKYNH